MSKLIFYSVVTALFVSRPPMLVQHLPNPGKEVVTINFVSPEDQPIELMPISDSGLVLVRQHLNAVSGGTSFEFQNLNNLAEIYFIKVTDYHVNKNFKILLE